MKAATEPAADIPSTAEEDFLRRQKLLACPRHFFIRYQNVDRGKPVGGRNKRSMWRCQLCQGETTGQDVYWYAVGLSHGRNERKK